MKEIIYIQAGPLANYAGTHFWNAQESYITYDDDEKPLTCHDVSFRETSDSTDQPGQYATLCPRLLLFDRKANFGTLSRDNAFSGDDQPPQGAHEDGMDWNGDVVEFRQDRIPKSSYQIHMEESLSRDLDTTDGNHNGLEAAGAQETCDIRYWSDYNRVFYVPRSIQKLPDAPEWETSCMNWAYGQEMFTRYDNDTDLMEGPLRLFLEECDHLQGIQVINDVDGFGGFMDSFLTSFRDDMRKVSSLVFPIMSSAHTDQVPPDDVSGLLRHINDAWCLRNFGELSTMTVPIQSPENWPDSIWSIRNPDKTNVYHQSAILSSHIESLTLPLRLVDAKIDMAGYCAQLNWRGITPFAEVCGALPALHEWMSHMTNLSNPVLVKNAVEYSRRDVTRGFSPSNLAAYDNWRVLSSNAQDPFVSTLHAPSYPLPTAFPPLLGSPEGTPSERLTTEMISNLTVTSRTSHIFKEKATFIESCLRRRSPALSYVSTAVDDLKDLANDLWTLADNFDGCQDALDE